jgi:hypothetical protein
MKETRYYKECYDRLSKIIKDDTRLETLIIDLKIKES